MEIYYTDEYNLLDNLFVEIDFIIKLNDNNKEIMFNEITYKINHNITKKYKINFNLKLKDCFYFVIKQYYNIINYYKYPLCINGKPFLYINIVFFGDSYIEDFEMLSKNKKLFTDRQLFLLIKILKKFKNIFKYHIYNGMKKLNIYKLSDDFYENNKIIYNKIINKFINMN